MDFEVIKRGNVIEMLGSPTSEVSALDLTKKPGDAYERYKNHLGKGLLLGLEFLVAADVVRTVVLEPTLQNVMILGLLVVIRTFLSWSLVVEIEGNWPWRRGERRGTESVEA